MEVLDIFDDIERRFMTASPEVHRICIPTADGPEQPLREEHSKFSGGNPVLQHTDSCEAMQAAGNGFSCSKAGLDLKLSSDALEQPNQAFIDGFERILEMKFGIMASRIRHGIDTWTLASYMVNPFESLSFVAEPSVLNRAYFKMWELIRLFGVVPLASQCQTFLSAHLCEGPGGFIEAVLDSRTRSVASENLAQTISDDIEREGDTGSAKQCDGFHKHLQKIVPNQQFASAVSELLSLDSPKISDEQNAPHSTKKLKRGHRGPRFEGKDATKSRNAKPDIQLSTENSTRKAGVNGSSFDSPPSTPPLKRVHIATLDAGVERAAFISDSDRADGAINPADSSQITKRVSEASNPISKPGGKARTPPRQYQDMWFGITLAQSKHQRDDAGYPPPSLETAKLSEKVAGNSTGNVFYGVDGSGDVTNPANMHAFVEHTLRRCNGRKMDLVTADGAFDVSHDFSAQEHSHLYLVFCEMVSAVRLQAEGGSFILKLFDCYAESTLTVLFVLSTVYTSVEVVRLRTTRICNSERYVVATGFLGLDPVLKDTLLKLTEEWHSCTLKGEKVGLCVAQGLPATLLDAVMESNTAIATSQIDGISRALELADVIGERLPSPNSAGSRKGAVSMLRRKVNTVKSKQRNAVALCKELQIPCRSQFRGANCDVPQI